MNRRVRCQPFQLLMILGYVSTLFPTANARAAEVFTPRDVARTRYCASPVISPDGARIAYLLMIPRDPYEQDHVDFEDGPAYAELHVLSVSDNADRPFIAGPVSISGLAWTPGSDAVTFLDKRGKDKNKSLYRIPIDGGEARRILTHDTDIASYSLSPDGRRVAFLASDEGPDDRRELQEKGFKAEVYEEDDRFTRVWIAGLEDHDTSKPRMLELPGSAVSVHWSPAGDRLAVALSPTPLIDDEYMKTRVHIVEVESGNIVCRLENPGKLGAVAWSPDGGHVAMISAEDINDPSEGRLMAAPADGGSLKDLLPDYLGHVSAIAWQSDDTVMYIGDEGLSTAFGKVGLSAQNRKVIVDPGKIVLTAFSLSRDGMKGAFIGESAAHPPEVFYMEHGYPAPRRLTTSNPWLDERRFAQQEAVTYKARDGLELQGVMIRPLDEKPGEKYPLILYVHGGPEAHERNGWLTNYSRPGQVAAARGFAVFYPNYRGSTGRGVAFSKLGQGDEAGKEFDDLVDAAEHLVSAGLVDRKRVGITGGSYGGYAAAWGATAQSEHFAASVMFVGISDTVSKKGTTDIPNEDYLVHTRSRLWEDKWQFCLERSPIYHVTKARTPILILHGKDDPRVHPSQSMELYRHLKTLGQAPVRLIWYPGEGHGNRRAAARLDYNLRMLQWMEHYLKGPGGEPPPMDIDYGLKDSATNKAAARDRKD